MYNFGNEFETFEFKAMIVFAVIGIIAAIGGVIYVFAKLFEVIIKCGT